MCFYLFRLKVQQIVMHTPLSYEHRLLKESLTKSSQNCAEGSFEVFRGEREKERKKEREKEIKKERERERKKKIDRERVCV